MVSSARLFSRSHASFFFAQSLFHTGSLWKARIFLYSEEESLCLELKKGGGYFGKNMMKAGDRPVAARRRNI